MTKFYSMQTASPPHHHTSGRNCTAPPSGASKIDLPNFLSPSAIQPDLLSPAGKGRLRYIEEGKLDGGQISRVYYSLGKRGDRAVCLEINALTESFCNSPSPQKGALLCCAIHGVLAGSNEAFCKEACLLALHIAMNAGLKPDSSLTEFLSSVFKASLEEPASQILNEIILTSAHHPKGDVQLLARCLGSDLIEDDFKTVVARAMLKLPNVVDKLQKAGFAPLVLPKLMSEAGNLQLIRDCLGATERSNLDEIAHGAMEAASFASSHDYPNREARHFLMCTAHSFANKRNAESLTTSEYCALLKLRLYRPAGPEFNESFDIPADWYSKDLFKRRPDLARVCYEETAQALAASEALPPAARANIESHCIESLRSLVAIRGLCEIFDDARLSRIAECLCGPDGRGTAAILQSLVDDGSLDSNTRLAQALVRTEQCPPEALSCLLDGPFASPSFKAAIPGSVKDAIKEKCTSDLEASFGLFKAKAAAGLLERGDEALAERITNKMFSSEDFSKGSLSLEMMRDVMTAFLDKGLVNERMARKFLKIGCCACQSYPGRPSDLTFKQVLDKLPTDVARAVVNQELQGTAYYGRSSASPFLDTVLSIANDFAMSFFPQRRASREEFLNTFRLQGEETLPSYLLDDRGYSAWHDYIEERYVSGIRAWANENGTQ